MRSGVLISNRIKDQKSKRSHDHEMCVLFMPSKTLFDRIIHYRNKKLIGFFHRIKSISFLPEAFQCENIKELLTSTFFRHVMLPNSILNRYRFNFMNAPCFIRAKFLFNSQTCKIVVVFYRILLLPVILEMMLIRRIVLKETFNEYVLI